MKLHIKWALATLVGLAVTGVGMSTANAAATSDKYLSGNVGYVRTKKAMYVGIYKKTNGKYKQVKVKKNTLLSVGSTMSSNDGHGGVKTTALFSYGVVNYARAKALKYKNIATIPFTKANFKRVNLKAPIRTQVFLSGKGYTANSTNTKAEPTAGFYLTLDNYLQYYSKAAMAKDTYLFGNRWATDGHAYKPTHSVKVSKVTVKGNTTIVYYSKAVPGLPNKKLSKGHYRLKITNKKTTGSLGINPVDDTFDSIASWTNYSVNGKAYHFGEVEYGN
ncbi:hypothetical protein [Levilactobacillus andaensis]|uniref:hypothetical protein n=1 Tax=Levilactobacillus andaensis TaxID=2799570 RepID=UPI0019407BEB|nr:hypothetical protein [Levilactobacillus andaensis]